jgi:hypothetical protein
VVGCLVDHNLVADAAESWWFGLNGPAVNANVEAGKEGSQYTAPGCFVDRNTKFTTKKDDGDKK